MSDRGTDAELARAISALIEALQDVQRELEPGNRRVRRLPTPRELLRFTSEVTIPAAILVLETNIRVLKLLQRAIRTSTREDTSRTSAGVREHAESLSRETLRQLDGALDDLQSAVEGRPPSDEADELFTEARRLQEQVERHLARREADGDRGLDVDAPERTPVEIDVESEIESLKEQIDDGDDEGSDDT